jgi:tetratricopeptide (TPR) repeat protein
MVTQKNYINEDKSNISKLLVPRLFKNDENFQFEGAIHNQPVTKDPIVKLNTVLKHYGYIRDDKELMDEKFERTSSILKRELEKNPENVYYRFQLANSYGMHGDYKKAINSIEKAYNIAKKNGKDLSCYLYVHNVMAKMYLTRNMFMQAEEICKEAVELAEGYYSDLYYYLAKAQFELNKNTKAINNFRIYLDIIKEDGSLQQSSDSSFIFYTEDNLTEAYLYLIVLYERIEDFEQIINMSHKIKNKDKMKQIISKVIEACVRTEKFNVIKSYYQNKILNGVKGLSSKYLAELESQMMTMDEEKKYKIFDVFATEMDNYSILNKVRLRKLDDDELVKLIAEIDFNTVANYYGDIIYYLLKNKYSLLEFCDIIKEPKLNDFLQYILDDNKIDDLSSVIYSYLEVDSEVDDLNELNINKILERYVLILDEIDDEAYYRIFNKYINDGSKYISSVYSNNVIDNEAIQFVKNDEEKFFICIYHARKNKEDNPKLYLKYLRKALNSYSGMKKGIKMLVDEFDKKENNNVKNNINNLISEGDLKKAKELINQYEDIRENDIEIYSMKSVISIMKNDLKKAKEIILAGLKQEQENFDLLYNLGYIYENNNNYKRAYLIYNKAEENVQSKEQKQDVEEGLKRVGEKLEKKTDYNDHYVIKNDKNKISCNPFFIVGCGRSGSTLVRSVLNTHQKISIPPENITLANMIKTYNELNFVAWEDVVGATIDEFKDNPQYSFWEIDLKKLRKNLIDLNEGERTLRKLIDVIYLTFAQNNFPQATMWGNKTPLNSLNISLIDQVFLQ